MTTAASIKCEPHGLYMCSHCAMKVSDSDLTLLRITFANIAKHTGSPSDAMVESALLELIEARRALTAEGKRMDWLEQQILLGRFEVAQSLYRTGFEFGWHKKGGAVAAVHSGTLREAIDAAMEKANG